MVALTRCGSVLCCWNCLPDAGTGASSKLDGQSPGSVINPLCSADNGTSIFAEELHWLPDTTNSPLSSAANDSCCSDGEVRIRLLPADTGCTRPRPVHEDVAGVLSTEGNCPLLVKTVDGAAHDRLRSTFTGLDTCWWPHSSDRTSANLDDTEWVLRPLLTSSALCRCLRELNVHRYTASGQLGKRCFMLVEAAALDDGANDGCNNK